MKAFTVMVFMLHCMEMALHGMLVGILKLLQDLSMERMATLHIEQGSTDNLP